MRTQNKEIVMDEIDVANQVVETTKKLMKLVETLPEYAAKKTITKEYFAVPLSKPDETDDYREVVQNPSCYYIPVGDGLYRPTMNRRVFLHFACKTLIQHRSTIIPDQIDVLLKAGYQLFDICLAVKQDYKLVNSIRIREGEETLPPYFVQAWKSSFSDLCAWHPVRMARTRQEHTNLKKLYAEAERNTQTSKEAGELAERLESKATLPSAKLGFPVPAWQRNPPEIVHNEHVRELASKVADQLKKANAASSVKDELHDAVRNNYAQELATQVVGELQEGASFDESKKKVPSPFTTITQDDTHSTPYTVLKKDEFFQHIRNTQAEYSIRTYAELTSFIESFNNIPLICISKAFGVSPTMLTGSKKKTCPISAISSYKLNQAIGKNIFGLSSDDYRSMLVQEIKEAHPVQEPATPEKTAPSPKEPKEQVAPEKIDGRRGKRTKDFPANLFRTKLTSEFKENSISDLRTLFSILVSINTTMSKLIAYMGVSTNAAYGTRHNDGVISPTFADKVNAFLGKNILVGVRRPRTKKD